MPTPAPDQTDDVELPVPTPAPDVSRPPRSTDSSPSAASSDESEPDADAEATETLPTAVNPAETTAPQPTPAPGSGEQPADEQPAGNQAAGEPSPTTPSAVDAGSPAKETPTTPSTDTAVSTDGSTNTVTVGASTDVPVDLNQLTPASASPQSTDQAETSLEQTISTLQLGSGNNDGALIEKSLAALSKLDASSLNVRNVVLKPVSQSGQSGHTISFNGTAPATSGGDGDGSEAGSAAPVEVLVVDASQMPEGIKLQFNHIGLIVVIGGAGADSFTMSRGKDVIADFNISEGDAIVIPDDLDLNLTISQSGDHLLLIDEANKIRTKLLHVDRDDFIAAFPELL